MNPFSQRVPGFLSLFVIFFCATVSSGDEASERRDRLRSLEQQLAKVRESLHEAHLELGTKTDRIVELEKQLASRPSGDSNARADSKIKKELSGAIRKIRDLEKRLAEKRSSEKRLAAKNRSQPSDKKPAAQPKKVTAKFEVESISISYDPKSAVSREGREEVHAFVSKCLEKNPETKFRVEGGADDSDFETVNEVIAQNRARYLVDYLLIKGLPEAAFPEIITTSTAGEKGSQKFVRVTLLTR